MARCHHGWHQRRSSGGHILWFQVLGRLRDPGRTLVYRAGPAPSESVCRKVWCFGESAHPWRCDACEQAVDAE